MNNAIMYEYQDYGDSESKKSESLETDKDANLDSKVKKLMEEKGICVEEVDDSNENKSADGSDEDGEEGDEMNELQLVGSKAKGLANINQSASVLSTK